MKYHRLDNHVPMFPDGRLIAEGELGDWQEAVTREFPEESAMVARAIVSMIRARCN